MRLRQLCAAAGALALVAGSVVFGTTAAYAAPAPPTVTTPTDGATVTTGTPSVEGDFVDDGETDAVRVESSSDGGGTWEPYCDAMIDSGGGWQCQTVGQQGPGVIVGALEPGQNLVRAWASNTVQGVTESTAGTPITVTYSAPPTPVDPVITAPANFSYVTTSSVSFAGTGTPGADIEVLDSSFVPFCTATADTGGAWACAATVADGAHTAIPNDVDNSREGPGIEFTVDTVAPAAPTLDPVETPIQTGVTPTFSGTGIFGETVHATLDGATACTSPVGQGGTWACSPAAPPAAGTYSIAAQQIDAAGNVSTPSPAQSLVVSDPPPTPPSVTDPGAGSTVSTPTPSVRGTYSTGEGVTGVEVRWSTDQMVWLPYCDASLVGGGDWECLESDVTGSLAEGQVYLQPTALNASGSATGDATPLLVDTFVPAPPAPKPTPAPAPKPTPTPTPTPAPVPTTPPKPKPIVWSFSIGGSEGPLAPGGTVDLSSDGLPPGSVIVFELHSTPMALGSAKVGPDGSFAYTITVPRDAEPGSHHIVGTLTHTDGTPPSTVKAPVEVAPTPPAETEPDTEPATGGETVEVAEEAAGGAAAADARGEASDGPVIPRTEPAAPTAITGKVPTVVDVVTSPVSVATAGGMAIAVLLLAALPTEILNTTLSTNTRRFGRFFTRIEDATDRVTEWFTSRSRTSAIPAAVLILITAIVFGFTDSGFGFDIASVRLVLSLGIGLFLVTWVASVISGLIMQRRWGVQSSILLQPVALVFAVIGVVLARLLDFSPGFLIGLVIGLELGSQLRAGDRVRAVVVQFAVVGGISVLAWLGYTLAVVMQGSDEPTFFSALLQDTLIATTAEGLTALMVAMLPIGFLDGKEIFDHSKKLWVAMFLIVGTVFALLVLPTELDGQEVADLGVWLLVLIGYCVVTLGLWLLLRVTEDSDDDESRKLEMVG